MTERMVDNAIAERRSRLAEQLRGRAQGYRDDVEILRKVQQRIASGSDPAPLPELEGATTSAKPTEEN